MKRLVLFALLALASFQGWSQRSVFDDTAFIYDESFSQANKSAGQDYLEQNALIFYDFTQLTGTDGSSVSNGNAGLEDYGPNAHTATILGTPTVEELNIGTHSGVKSLGVTGTSAISTGHDGSTWFSSSFRITYAFWIADGRPASGNVYLCGGRSTNSFHDFNVLLAASTNYEINIRFRTPAGDSRWDGNNTALLPDGPGFYVLEIEYNFDDDEVEVLLNGSPVAGAFVSGSIGALDPSGFDPDVDFAIGSANFSGTIQTNPTTLQVVRFAVTSGTGSVDEVDIRDYMNFEPSGSGTGFLRWDKHQTVGFTATTSNDSLILSGQPHGFQDYMVFKEPIPDSLGEFRTALVVTINEDLQAGDTGIGIGIINNVDAEANHGVYGELITDPTLTDLAGKIQLYSGTGAVSPTAFTWRTTSSGALPVAKDSSFLLILERDIQGNEVFYSFTCQSLYDSTTVTVGWTGTRDSDQYFGTTMRVFIRLNGGPFRILPITLYRTGDEGAGGGGPPPPPFEADLVVSKSGSDANNCAPSTPCLTFNRVLIRAGELAPAEVDIAIGPGTFVETSFLSIPTNVGEVRGAGVSNTIIKGASNLFTAVTEPNRSSQDRALVRMVSGSDVTITTHFRDMTFDGGYLEGGNTNSMRGCFAVRNRNGLKLTDVDIRYFNTYGWRLWETEDVVMTRVHLFETSGVNGTSFTYYAGEWYNVDNITMTDCLIEAPTFGRGSGLGFVGGGGDNRYMTNVTLENVIFNVNPDSPDAEGHNFNIEWIYCTFGNVLLKNCYFNSNLSLNQRSASLGDFRITECTFNLPQSVSLAVEMQLDNIEIDHCFVVGPRSGVFVIYNNNGTSPSAPIPSFSNWNIHHNIIQLTRVNGFNHGFTGGSAWPVDDIVFANNTVHALQTEGPRWWGFITDDFDTATGIILQNNVIIGQLPPNSQWIEPDGPVSGGINRNNTATHLNVNQSRSGFTNSNNQVTSNLGLKGGTLPTTWEEAFTGPYYEPGPGSVLIGTGFGGVNRGAR